MDRTAACGAADAGSIPAGSTMVKIFGYGSLLCEDSIRKTVPEYRVIGPGVLPGYKRVFCVRAPHRKNHETGVYSSVLNLVKDERFNTMGMLYEIPENELPKLHLREKGYVLEKISLRDGTSVSVYIYPKGTDYRYVQGDPAQKEYLDICLEAAQKISGDMYENFLDSTFMGKKPLREWLSERQ